MGRKTGTAGSEIGARYAAALFDLVNTEEAGSQVASSMFTTEESDADLVEADLRQLADMLDTSDDLHSLTTNPVFSKDIQKSTITNLLQKAGAHEMVVNIAGLMAANGRLFALRAMIKAYLKMAADARGEVSAEAISAVALDDAQVAALKNEIESGLGKTVNLETRTDESLLGGLVVKVGSRMIDTSLRTKLNQMKLAMKEA